MKSFLLALAVFLGLRALEVQAAGRPRVVAVTPTITADAYADGDQMGTLFEIPLGSPALELLTLTVIDKADAKDAFSLLLFSSSAAVPTSADNAAASVTDALMSSYYLGKIAVAAADFTSTGANADAVKEVRRPLAPVGSKSLYGLLVCKDSGGCDYASTTDLVLKFGFLE